MNNNTGRPILFQNNRVGGSAQRGELVPVAVLPVVFPPLNDSRKAEK